MLRRANFSRLSGLALACLLTLLPDTGDAACRGTDLRKHLTPEAKAAVQRQVSTIPFAEGLHWVATKGDQTIHVVGTHHAGDRRHAAVVRTVTPYLRKADLLMLEIRGADIEPQWEAVKENPRVLFRTQGPGLQQLMRRDNWDALTMRMRLLGFTPKQVSRLQPWFISGAVVRGDCDPYGWNRSKGLDARLERFANTIRLPVIGLETVEETMRAQSKEPIRDQVKRLEMDMRSKQASANLATTLRNGYFTERLSEARVTTQAAMYLDLNVPRSEVVRLLRGRDKYLLDERHKNWMPRILARKEKTIVVAVGASHLPGPQGVLNQLARRGYVLTRIPR